MELVKSRQENFFLSVFLLGKICSVVGEQPTHLMRSDLHDQQQAQADHHIRSLLIFSSHIILIFSILDYASFCTRLQQQHAFVVDADGAIHGPAAPDGGNQIK